jgi:hypothetical protein
MRFAYLTTAYHELGQLGRLQRALAMGDPDGYRFVQFDSTSPFAAQLDAVDADVHFTRAGIAWGDGSYLDALLNSLDIIRSQSWDWLVLLSGQDHPVRPLAELHASVENEGALAFSPLRATAVSVIDGDDEPISRYFYRYATPRHAWPAWARKSALVAGRGAGSISGGRVRLQPRPRGAAPAFGVRSGNHPFSSNRPCHQGSEYVAMSRFAVDALLALAESEPALIGYMRRTFIPTEAFFATGLRWTLRGDVYDRSLHYMHYGGKANPKTLAETDRGTIEGSKQFFARKFIDESEWVEEAFSQ